MYVINNVKKFCNVFQRKLGVFPDRVSAIFRNYGPNLKDAVDNVLLHAAEQGKMDKVVGLLETHYEKYLQFQRPEVRGLESQCGSPTGDVFLFISSQILAL